MTKEQIEARKAELMATRDQLIGQLNATEGALQDCDYWIAQLNAQTAQKVPEAAGDNGEVAKES